MASSCEVGVFVVLNESIKFTISTWRQIKDQIKNKIFSLKESDPLDFLIVII